MGFIKQMEMEHKSHLYALQGMHEKHVAFVANDCHFCCSRIYSHNTFLLI